MKKLALFLPIMTFAFISLQTNANAQNTGVSVGNPESSNMIMMEEDYVVSTSSAQPANNQTQNQGTSEDNNASVVEDITETETPDSVSIEDDTMVVPNN